MSLRACMGGWCQQRSCCAHFHAPDRRSPIERMCERGHEAPVSMKPVHWLQRAAINRQRGSAQPFPEAA